MYEFFNQKTVPFFISTFVSRSLLLSYWELIIKTKYPNEQTWLIDKYALLYQQYDIAKSL